LLNLQKTNALQSQALERLSTGTQLNSAADNPAGLIASDTLQLQITAINGSINNSNLANNVIGTTDAALSEVGSLLNEIRGLVQQGVNTGAQSLPQIQADQAQIDSALSAINRIASNTQFAGQNLLDGSKAFTTVQTAADAAKVSDFSINQALFGSAPTVTVDAQVVSAATKGTLTYNGGNLQAATTLQVSGAKGSQVLFFGAGSSLTNVTDAVNANTDATGVSASITTAAVASTVSVGTVLANNALTFTDARQNAGASDPAVSVNFVVAGINTARSITVNGTAITVNVATDGLGGVAGTETASSIAAAIAANAQANALVTVTNTGASTGAGTVVSTGGAQTLTGGVNGVITLTSSDFGSKQFVGINVLNGTFQTFDSTNAASYRSTGTDIVARINGQQATGDGLKASLATSLLDASVTFAQASNTAGVDTKITVTGGGSLFQIGQNVSVAGQVGVGIDATNTATLGGSAGKIYQLGSGQGKSLLDVGQNGVTGANLVDIINQALTRVDGLRARLGALQKDVIQTNLDSLGVALQNITDARSQIHDTDFASTTAQLTQSQILAQAGISVLQIANQAPQQVLKLLG
jgi:flagellin